MMFAPSSYNEAIKKRPLIDSDDSYSGDEDDSYDNHMKAFVERLFI